MHSDQDVIQLLAELVRIPSVNPNYDGGINELACAEFIEGYLKKHGIRTWRQYVFPNRPNIIACVPGKNRKKRIVFEAHMDTVSIQGMTIPPFDPEIRDGKLYGRGACDTKGGLAAMLQALTSLGKQGIPPSCDVIFAAVVDEEYSFRGAVALCAGLEPGEAGQAASPQPLQADLAIIAEPTDLKLVAATKGVLRWQIETIGKAAHSSKPHLGKNAIVAMAKVIQMLDEGSRTLATNQHPLLGSPTLNIGCIQGGVQVNFVPDRCIIELDRRLLPGETWEAVFYDYDRSLDAIRKSDPALGVVMHPPMLTDFPLDSSQDRSSVPKVIQLFDAQGWESHLFGVPFGSDASKFAAQGIPSLVLGPGSIDQAHAAVEFVDCHQVIRAVEIYQQIMLLQL